MTYLIGAFIFFSDIRVGFFVCAVHDDRLETLHIKYVEHNKIRKRHFYGLCTNQSLVLTIQYCII